MRHIETTSRVGKIDIDWQSVPNRVRRIFLGWDLLICIFTEFLYRARYFVFYLYSFFFFLPITARFRRWKADGYYRQTLFHESHILFALLSLLIERSLHSERMPTMKTTTTVSSVLAALTVKFLPFLSPPPPFSLFTRSSE